MSISKAEDRLFAKWKKCRPNLVRDGVVDEAAYTASEPKILLVLKEVNEKGAEKVGGWDLRDYFKNPHRWQTVNALARWIIGIRELPARSQWKDVYKLEREKLKQALRSVAVMNLKKAPGGASADNRALAKAVSEDKNLLAEQFLLYDADIVICCGSVRYLVNEALSLDGTGWKMSSGGVPYYEYKQGKFLIAYKHPQARTRQEPLFCGLMDTVEELRRKEPAASLLASGAK